MDKGQTTIYKTLHRKLKIEQHEPGWTQVLRKVKQFLLYIWCPSCRFTLVTNLVISHDWGKVRIVIWGIYFSVDPYTRACGSYHHFESFTVATVAWLVITEYLCHKWLLICSVCRNHNPYLSSIMTYH
jgi:hypothetical protein